MKFLLTLLTALLLAPQAELTAAEWTFQSQHLAIRLSPRAAAFSVFAVDSLGQGNVYQNPVLPETNAIAGLELVGQTYQLKGQPVWRVTCGEKVLTLRSDYAAGVEAPPFTLTVNQKANHATLLGLMKPDERQMSLPCVLHLPDMGTLRITSDTRGAKLDYDARRFVKPAFVRIAFPAATAQHRRVEYQLEVVTIHPQLAGIERNPLYDGFRRDWLNIFQVNPRVQMLANNASSDPCAFTLFEYSDLARHTPPLADGLTANDLIRMTLDRYLAGAKGYGQAGYGPDASGADIIGWKTPWTSLDSLPSFLISACNYVDGSGDLKWARANYDKLAAWGREMFAADKNGNGLIEYPGTGNFGDRPKTDRRPANWWDTINFGHEDAFANALAYRGATMFAELARKLNHAEDARFFGERAAKLLAAYAPTLLNPATGVIAGWKSADGQLHDYWFTYVQGMAVTFGLLDEPTANRVMDRLLAKMREVGYTNFHIGLPGNLVPVKKGDYVHENHAPEATGEPLLDDGSDGFQFYENGGATGCWGYYTVKALYQLGRVEDARRIFHPMLSGYAAGKFQGFDPKSGRSLDWRDWQGGGHGYEGLLVDNYHALLAVLEDVEAKPYPAETWPSRTPEQVGLSLAKLDALRDLVGGRGCVVRHGYMVYAWGDQAMSRDVASAMKPVISTLLFLAIQEGKLKSADDPVSEFEPRLKELNHGKDAAITWRHLASQTSGYGLTELPGQAYSYNDYALALYYDTLTQKVFRTNGTALLKRYLAEPLQFEDDCTFEAFGPGDRPGRLAVSVRDFARFGLLYLRNGRWRDRQLVQPELIRTAINSPIPADLPLTLGQDAEMLPRQRSLGGKKNITPIGPGFYSFNWWLNRTNRLGQPLYVDAPPDTYIAGGHGGKRMLWIIPSLDILVSWNDSPIDDHDRSPGNADTRINKAALLIREAASGSSTESQPGSRTRLGIPSAGAENAAAAGRPPVEKYNVVWDSPSESSFGSMPLGNGDIGINVWVEKNGHLLEDGRRALPGQFSTNPCEPSDRNRSDRILLSESALPVVSGITCMLQLGDTLFVRDGTSPASSR